MIIPANDRIVGGRRSMVLPVIFAFERVLFCTATGAMPQKSNLATTALSSGEVARILQFGVSRGTESRRSPDSELRLEHTQKRG